MMLFPELRRILTITLLGAIGAAIAWGQVIPPIRPAPPQAAAASVALFVNSNLDSARGLAAAALRQDPGNLEALFVEMEAAALEADSSGALEAALRLCESSGQSDDPRAVIASARILEMAANTAPFRAAVPRIQRLLTSAGTPARFLRAALVAAAADGAPELSLLDLTRDSGLVTDWRAAGPFGTYPNVAFDRAFAPEYDSLAQSEYGGHAVEAFRFYDGNFTLPEYFSSAGVFYAASDLTVTAAGEYRLRAESGGTLELFVDGTSVLQKDDRWHAAPEMASASLLLNPGTHKLLVKFLPAATPFRIALSAPRERANPMAAKGNSAKPAATPASRPITGPAAPYISAALRFWLGDYHAAITQLTALRGQQSSAPIDFLLAQSWEQLGDDSPEQATLWESALKQAPLAAAAEYELAARAYSAEHPDEALMRVRRVIAARPAFEPTLHLLAQAAMQLKAHAEAVGAIEAEVQIHPSCATLASAAKFFTSIAAHKRAAELEQRLDGCAPGSLAYAEILAQAGRHREAAEAARTVALARPLDRNARALAVRELALAGNRPEAEGAARELVRLAPQAGRYRQLLEEVVGGAVVFDSSSVRARDFVAQEEFYSPYRRNGIDILHTSASRHFSGGPALTLLHDRVVRLERDGGVSLYVHKITRVLNRDGIEKYGEVSLPGGADLLELRTLKQDGSVVEPEFNQHKRTVSMPALAAGDAIDEEYVLHYSDGGIDAHRDAFRYTFGSFAAPILYARFVVLAPTESKIIAVSTSGAPAGSESNAGGITTRLWEQQDIPQSTEEVATPRGDLLLPSVYLSAGAGGAWPEIVDYYRNEVIEAGRIGPRVEQTAARLRSDGGDEETARNLYRLVTTRVRSSSNTFESGEIVSAEGTLANYAGSRTMALLALARAAGLDAELLLTRELDKPPPSVAARDAYTRPLVLFRFGQKQTVADAESEGLAFGVVPPTVAHDDALAVPVSDSNASRVAGPADRNAIQPAKALIVPVPPSGGDEHSIAEGDVTFDLHGNMSAHIVIRMGAARSAQMRSVLSGVQPGDRRRFFEQVAMRIFPGSIDAIGDVQHEGDPEYPLELRLSCRTPHLLVFNGDAADLDQLAPALGLRKMYGLGPRRLPLYLDMPLIETTTLRVHLPPGVRITGQPADLHLQNDFGSYSVQFRRTGDDQVIVRRAFRIPVQVITPDRFEAFAQFERHIEDAERQRLSLARERVAVHGPSHDQLAANTKATR